VRLCRQIGYDGFQNFKLALAADMARFAATQATATNDKGAIPNQLLQNTIAALHVVHDALDEKILRRIAARIRGAQRVDVYGVGISGLVAEVLAYKLLRIGIPARAFRDLTMARETADTMTKRDVAIAVSESGLTAEVAQLLGAAHLMGVHTLAITNRANSPLTEQADEVLITAYIESPLTGGALTSTTSQLHLIECLATAVADSGTPRRQKSRKA
jgi:DNA-binding MurR/RpiR family transcriptional regulator